MRLFLSFILVLSIIHFANANFVNFQANSNKGSLLLFNGIDRLLLVDGASKLCLSNGC